MVFLNIFNFLYILLGVFNLNTEKICLGVDIGNVIIARGMIDGSGNDTSFFSGNYLQTPAVAGVFDALRSLVYEKFGHDVFLVSKCGQKTQEKTQLWLEEQNFYERTGILRSHVKFCRQRHEKLAICLEFGINSFVDDRLEVLGNLIHIAKSLYLFDPMDSELKEFSNFLPYVTQVSTWDEIVKLELAK